MIEEIELSRKETRHVIAATASYHGDLIKDVYQFTFGGSSVNRKHSMYNGFLMPHSGYIKRFAVKIPGLKFFSPRAIEIKDLLRNSGFLGATIPLFTLVVLKEGENDAIDLATLNIILNSDDPNDDALKDEYVLVSHVAEGIEKYELEAKNVLSIRSEFGVSNSRTMWEKEYELEDPQNEFFTYLATILLELDPLV